jgi:geranylgeranyl diphosphate synthase type II
MVAGQVEDLAAEDKGSSHAAHSLETLAHIHANKTAALFRACLRMGAWSAWGENAARSEPALLQCLDKYGRYFGQAFQITDDLLDVEGDAAQTGKRVQKDASRGKLTYPGLLGAAPSRREAERLCQNAIDCVAPFGTSGDKLARLAGFLLERRS